MSRIETIGNATLYLGDCLEVMATMPADSIDLTVTSPPYDNLRTYNGFTFDFEGIARELYRVTKPGGVVVWVVGDATVKGSETGTSFRQALYFKDVCGFNLHDTMLYRTRKPPMNDRRYQSCFEYMFVLSKGAPATFNPLITECKYAGNNQTSNTYWNADGSKKHRHGRGPIASHKIREAIWLYLSGNNGDDKVNHPARFPEQLAADHIASWSNPGDVVLDPFMGSGTAGKMALLAGRRFIGIEISDEYLAIASNRIAEARRQGRLIA